MRNKQTSFIQSLPGRSEYTEGVTFANWLRMMQRMGKIKVSTHLANETYTTSWAAKKRNTASGLARGVPDYLIITSSGYILFPELKREKGGVVSPEQKLWIESINATGKGISQICRGADEAIAFVMKYL